MSRACISRNPSGSAGIEWVAGDEAGTCQDRSVADGWGNEAGDEAGDKADNEAGDKAGVMEQGWV